MCVAVTLSKHATALAASGVLRVGMGVGGWWDGVEWGAECPCSKHRPKRADYSLRSSKQNHCNVSTIK